ncbi:hypothetical protein Tco_0243346 [Tanacetum coccineum]
MTDKDSSAAGSKPMTPFVHTRPANNEVHKKVWKIKEYLTAFEPIIQNGRAQPCWSEYRRSFVNEIIPFYENIKNLSQNLDTDIYTEVKEFERSLDKMESDYDKCLADNKRLGDKNKHLLAKTRRLQRVMTNLSNDNERFIADNIAKDICFFVLSSEKQVSPRSNCSCKELQSNYDKGHSRVVALEAEVLEKQQMLAKSEHQSSLIQKQFVDLQLKFQNYKERLQNEKVCVPPNATASNAIVEINQLKYQLQRKDDTIRNLETQINIMRMLNVGPTTGSLDQQALETEVTQLKDALTSLRIQNDGYKIENANVNRRYLELSTASTHSRTTLTGKMAILNAEIAKLKAEAVGKKNSGPTELVKPKVLASMMYTKSSKYIVPPKRANWVQPTPLPKKKQFVVHSTKSVHVKTHQAKCAVNTSKNAWKATKEDVARIVPQWKPTGKRFNLCDIYGPRMSTEPIVTPSKFTPCVSPRTNVTLSMEPVLKPLELTPCVSSSSSSTVTMVSRFFDYRLGDRKAGSNGISAIFE